MTRCARGMIVAILLSLVPATVAAQSYPNRLVRVLVPYAAGGAVDALARTIGQALTRIWGRQPVVDNRPGAGGIIASQVLIQSPPDGYTLILVAAGHPLNQFFYPELPYDTFGDFTAITEVSEMPLTINVAKNSPVGNLKELLEQARAKPGALSYGMSGYGTSAHLAGVLLNHMADVNIVPIPYKGGAPALSAVIAGEIAMSINPASEVIGQIEGGTVRALAVSTATRSPTLPDVPTVAEQGLQGYACGNWYGLLGPRGMEPPLVTKIHDDVAMALEDPTVIDYFAKVGSVAVGSTPEAFEAFMHAEADKWGPVVKAANIRQP
jgi:tripartite-type tricarboxylate transporter receptor subunit TctC